MLTKTDKKIETQEEFYTKPSLRGNSDARRMESL
jgi:hypothetical protein